MKIFFGVQGAFALRLHYNILEMPAFLCTYGSGSAGEVNKMWGI